MKKILKNNSGFTLVEVLVAIGISATLIVVINRAQRESIYTKRNLTITSEVNELTQLITSELTKIDSCSANFKGLTFVTDPPTVPQTRSVSPAITQINNRNGQALIKVGKYFETDTGAGQKYQETIQSIDSIAMVDTVASPTRASLIISYTIRRFRPVQDNNGTIIATPQPLKGSFTIGLNVFFSKANAFKIDSCFSDVETSLASAVQYACTGNGAKWTNSTLNPLYGKCEHYVELQSSTSNTPVAGIALGAGNTGFRCPSGEALSMVVDPTDVAQTDHTNRRILKCAKISTTTTCGPWQYLAGINADGSANCNTILSLFAGNGIIAVQQSPSLAYKIVNITCPAGQVLQKLTGPNFTPGCVNPNVNWNCPAGQYAYGADNSGSPLCRYYTNQNACSGGTSWMTAIDSVGNVTCGTPTTTGSCPSPQLVNGTTTAGAVTCTTMPN